MVGLGGLEPPASPLSGVRSNQLSYRPGELPAAVRASLLRKLGGYTNVNRRPWDCLLRKRALLAERVTSLLRKLVMSQHYVAGSCAIGTRRSRRPRRERQTIRVSARIGHRAGSGHPACLLSPLRLAARIPVAPRDATVSNSRCRSSRLRR